MNALCYSALLLLAACMHTSLCHEIGDQPFTVPPLPPEVVLTTRRTTPRTRTIPIPTVGRTQPPVVTQTASEPPPAPAATTAPRPEIPVIMLTKKRLQGALGNAVLRSEEGISGTIELRDDGALLTVSGLVYGLSDGEHALVVHDWGNITTDCDDIGEHFNPDWFSHGPIDSPLRHNGDLGNIVDGAPFAFATDAMTIMGGRHSVLGRAIAVHRQPDDLGAGDSAESKKRGSAGPAVACAIIARTDVIYA